MRSAEELHNSAEAGARNGLDVTGSTSAQPDGFIASGDALAVINYINAKGSGHIPAEAGYGPPFCDVTGDDEVAADDVLKVINYINSGNGQEGEAGGGFSAVESESYAASQGVMLEQVAPSAFEEKSPPDLLSLMAVDLATAHVKRRRLSF